MEWLFWIAIAALIVAAVVLGILMGAGAVFGGFLGAWFDAANKRGSK